MAVYSVRWGGNLFGDIWTCGVHMATESLITIDPSAQLEDVRQDVTKWYNAIGAAGGSDLRWCSFNEIDRVTRRYTNETDSYHLDFTPVQPQSNTYQAPQLSLAASLITAAKRGIASRGRIYPPPTSFTVSSTGRVNGLVVRDATTVLIRDLNNFPGMDANNTRVVVLGKNGYWRSVTAVAVGDVIDTQRRRRNAIREQYTQVSI